MGWNCNHNFAPFQEGSKRNYTDEQLQDMKEHTVTYNGESMPDYEASQLQRGMERDIRKTKRELTALDELQKNKPTEQTKAEFSALSVKLKNQEAKLKNFCRQTERRLDTTRTGVFATQSGMGFGRSTSAKAVWANRKSLTGSGNGSIINLNRRTGNTGAFSGLSERMSKKHIREVADKFGVDISGLTFNIDTNEELLHFPYAGEAVSSEVGKITFFPNAFKSEEELVRTLYHERVHVQQFKEFGAEYVQNHREEFERKAYEDEDKFIQSLKARGLM